MRTLWLYSAPVVYRVSGSDGGGSGDGGRRSSVGRGQSRRAEIKERICHYTIRKQAYT